MCAGRSTRYSRTSHAHSPVGHLPSRFRLVSRRRPRRSDSGASSTRAAIGYACPDFNDPAFETLTVTRMLDQTAAAIAAAPGGPVALVGSSLGAFVAVHAAVRDARERAPARRSSRAAGAGARLRRQPAASARRARDRRVAARGEAAGVPLRTSHRARRRLRALRGRCALRCVQREPRRAGARIPGHARRVGRSVHGRALGGIAHERRSQSGSTTNTS